MAYKNLVRRIKFIVNSTKNRGFKHVTEVLYQAYVRRKYYKKKTKDELIISNSKEFLAEFKKNYSFNFPISKANNKEFFASALLSLQSYDSILEEAEQVTEGRITLLGHSIYEPSGEFNWHKDYAVGKEYELKFFNQFNFFANDKSDVKRVWELSRMYWLWWIGKAFWISGNGVWAKEFMRLIDNWNTQNPTNYGLNWAMPMEIAIRGYWLTMGFGLFYGAPNITDEWWCNYIKNVYNHAEHLSNNLEYFPNLTNHYISNCFGLVAFGSFFYHTNKGKEWFNQGYMRLVEEIEKQVLDDGVHYELSICYHRLVAEMFLTSAILCKQTGKPLPASALDKIEKMCEFINDYSQKNIPAPQFGDSDDGLLLRLSNEQNIYLHDDILALAAVVFNREDFTEKCNSFSQAGLLLCGAAGYEQFRILQKQFEQKNKNQGKSDKNGSKIKLYGKAGFAILNNNHFFAMIDCGKIGLHGNNDTLSFVLNTRKSQIIIDPGSYCYTSEPALRNALRSSKSHNAVVIDSAEIAEFDGLWRVKQEIAKPTCKILNKQKTEDIAGKNQEPSNAENTFVELCLQTRQNKIIKRICGLEGNIFHLKDSIESEFNELTTLFCLHQSCELERLGENIFLIKTSNEVIKLKCSEKLTAERIWYSPSYGIAVSCWALVLNHRNKNNSAYYEVEYEFSFDKSEQLI